MHVFLSEYLTCGALAASAELKPSLAVEGAAMLRALAEDAVAADHDVSITWDPACGDFGVCEVEIRFTSNSADERRCFRELAGSADATLVIAPEFDGILENRCRMISVYGGCNAGSSAEAIALCADKLRLADHLKSNGIATIDTWPCEREWSQQTIMHDVPFPLVVKPQFGAGSLHSFLLTNIGDLQQAQAELRACGMRLIVQPWIAGRALSVAGVVSRNGIEMFPLCTQNIHGNRLEYAGGTVPASVERADSVIELARRAIASVPGLRGYVGVDLILPDDGPPVVVEINPRLTSSYHGYRHLAANNIAPHILQPDVQWNPVAWNRSPVAFGADGLVR